jgi:hypothetical protein
MSPTEKLIQIHHLAEDAIHNPDPGKTLASIAGIALTPVCPAIVWPPHPDILAPRVFPAAAALEAVAKVHGGAA